MPDEMKWITHGGKADLTSRSLHLRYGRFMNRPENTLIRAKRSEGHACRAR
ncbi:hypothetical protein THTE_0372 [Thermogutta terrifontis]|uniref:Uncharacterized protein n=1 Tax=Thermogutta terrifontis TaxID=1331910 RepID=A0A286RAI1_9BACT|nr:hypothetical protein THTE_0372 [Thermogutta terrifontis]